MRAFIGIGLPEEVRESLASLQRELAHSQADVKWVEPRNLHVTLKFLDEITDAQRQVIEELLKRLAVREAPCSLGLGGVGAFPSVESPRVVWVGLTEGKNQLARVAAQIEQETRTMALRREARPFAAHLTIGRVRSPRHRQQLTERLREVDWQPPAPWRVESLVLYQSVLGPAGPRYSALADIPLVSS